MIPLPVSRTCLKKFFNRGDETAQLMEKSRSSIMMIAHRIGFSVFLASKIKKCIQLEQKGPLGVAWKCHKPPFHTFESPCSIPLQGLSCYHNFPPDVKKVAHIPSLPIGSKYASHWFDLLLIIN